MENKYYNEVVVGGDSEMAVSDLKRVLGNVIENILGLVDNLCVNLSDGVSNSDGDKLKQLELVAINLDAEINKRIEISSRYAEDASSDEIEELWSDHIDYHLEPIRMVTESLASTACYAKDLYGQLDDGERQEFIDSLEEISGSCYEDMFESANTANSVFVGHY